MEELEKYMKALVLLQIDAAQENGKREMPDALLLQLSNAGFTNAEIAALVNKKPDTVKHAISRAKKEVVGTGRGKAKRRVKK